MSTPEEYGLTDEDREKLGEILDSRKQYGQKVKFGNSGVDGGAVETALRVAPEQFTPTKYLITAWLFEHGASTATEVSDATGASYQTALSTLKKLVDARLAHTHTQREFDGRGRDPTVFVPRPDGVPEHYQD